MLTNVPDNQLPDGLLNADLKHLAMSAQTATPSPNLVGDLLARAFERVLLWPCPQCGQPYPCACDAPQPQRTVELTHSPLAEGETDAGKPL
jgi:hypothetical protein